MKRQQDDYYPIYYIRRHQLQQFYFISRPRGIALASGAMRAVEFTRRTTGKQSLLLAAWKSTQPWKIQTHRQPTVGQWASGDQSESRIEDR
ncbi:hypothetical protein OUZ56_001616 [Daphnia magna]|uniref:Uncharacterized protein n=1 Tax=Daphnia magna TaxID=35525 RepID=A0ABR0A378_9CRUS|nr:hypothetical protein OUZ56_001616 [Daphnia magna]